MITQHELQAATAEGLIKSIGKEGMLDAVFTVAVYLALGALLKTFDVPID